MTSRSLALHQRAYLTAYTRLTLHYQPRISVFIYERDTFLAEAIKKVFIFLQDFFDRFGPFYELMELRGS